MAFVKLPGQFQWDKLSKREQLIAGVTIVVVIGAIGFYLHNLQQKKLGNLRAQLADLGNEIASLRKVELPAKQQEVERAMAQQAVAKQRESLAAQAKEQLAGGGGFSSLLSEIVRTAKDEEIDVVAVKPGEINDQGDYVELPLTIEIRSQFRGLGEYLQRLEHLPQLVVVGRIRMETTTQTSPVLSVGLEAVSFMGKV